MAMEKVMSNKLYPFIAAGLALIIGDMTYGYMARFAVGVIEGTALAPNRYRVLVAFIFQPLSSLIGSFGAAIAIIFLSLAIAMPVIDLIGQRVGAANTRTVMMATFSITPAIIFLHPAGAHLNILELVFFSVAVLLTLDGRKWALFPLVILATLNRETAVIIPLVYWLVTRDKWRSVGMGGVWLITYLGVRLVIGPVPSLVSLADILRINLSLYWLVLFGLGLVFVGWLFVLAWQGWKESKGELRRAAYALPVYFAMIVVFGVWAEWRLIISVYPLLIPLAGLTRN